MSKVGELKRWVTWTKEARELNLTPAEAERVEDYVRSIGRDVCNTILVRQALEEVAS